MTDKPCPRCTNATTPLANVNRFHLCDLHLRTIARDTVAKFQRGGVSTLFAEGNVDG